MEFIASVVRSIDRVTVLITLGVAIIVYNTVQIVRYAIVKKKAEAEIKQIDAKIAGLDRDLAEIKRSLAEKIKNYPR